MAHQHQVGSDFGIGYFFGFLAVLLLPTLPATLTWLNLLN